MRRIVTAIAAAASLLACPVAAADVDLGAVSKMALNGFSASGARGMAYSSDGSLYIAHYDSNRVYRVAPGAEDLTPTVYFDNSPDNSGATDVAFSADESTMYVLDWSAGRLKAVPTASPGVGGTVVATFLYYPRQVAIVHSSGDALVTSNAGGLVLRVIGLGAGDTPRTLTFVGQGHLSSPFGIAVKQDEDRSFATTTPSTQPGIFEVTSGVPVRLVGPTAATAGSIVDGAGLAASVKAARYTAMTKDNQYMLFVDDHTVRRLNVASGNFEVDTLVNRDNVFLNTGSGTANGISYLARLENPQGIAITHGQTQVAYSQEFESQIWKSPYAGDAVSTPPPSTLPAMTQAPSENLAGKYPFANIKTDTARAMDLAQPDQPRTTPQPNDGWGFANMEPPGIGWQQPTIRLLTYTENVGCGQPAGTRGFANSNNPCDYVIDNPAIAGVTVSVNTHSTFLDNLVEPTADLARIRVSGLDCDGTYSASTVTATVSTMVNGVVTILAPARYVPLCSVGDDNAVVDASVALPTGPNVYVRVTLTQTNGVRANKMAVQLFVYGPCSSACTRDVCQDAFSQGCGAGAVLPPQFDLQSPSIGHGPTSAPPTLPPLTPAPPLDLTNMYPFSSLQHDTTRAINAGVSIRYLANDGWSFLAQSASVPGQPQVPESLVFTSSVNCPGVPSGTSGYAGYYGCNYVTDDATVNGVTASVGTELLLNVALLENSRFVRVRISGLECDGTYSESTTTAYVTGMAFGAPLHLWEGSGEAGRVPLCSVASNETYDVSVTLPVFLNPGTALSIRLVQSDPARVAKMSVQAFVYGQCSTPCTRDICLDSYELSCGAGAVLSEAYDLLPPSAARAVVPTVALDINGKYVWASLQHDHTKAMETRVSDGASREQLKYGTPDGWNFANVAGVSLAQGQVSTCPGLSTSGLRGYRNDACHVVDDDPARNGLTAARVDPSVSTGTRFTYFVQDGMTLSVSVRVAGLNCDSGAVTAPLTVNAYVMLSGGSSVSRRFAIDRPVRACSNNTTESTDITAADVSLNQGDSVVVEVVGTGRVSVQMFLYASCDHQCTSLLCVAEYDRTCRRGEPIPAAMQRQPPQSARLAVPAPTPLPMPPSSNGWYAEAAFHRDLARAAANPGEVNTAFFQVHDWSLTSAAVTPFQWAQVGVCGEQGAVIDRFGFKGYADQGRCTYVRDDGSNGAIVWVGSTEATMVYPLRSGSQSRNVTIAVRATGFSCGAIGGPLVMVRVLDRNGIPVPGFGMDITPLVGCEDDNVVLFTNIYTIAANAEDRLRITIERSVGSDEQAARIDAIVYSDCLHPCVGRHCAEEFARVCGNGLPSEVSLGPWQQLTPAPTLVDGTGNFAVRFGSVSGNQSYDAGNGFGSSPTSAAINSHSSRKLFATVAIEPSARRSNGQSCWLRVFDRTEGHMIGRPVELGSVSGAWIFDVEAHSCVVTHGTVDDRISGSEVIVAMAGDGPTLLVGAFRIHQTMFHTDPWFDLEAGWNRRYFSPTWHSETRPSTTKYALFARLEHEYYFALNLVEAVPVYGRGYVLKSWNVPESDANGEHLAQLMVFDARYGTRRFLESFSAHFYQRPQELGLQGPTPFGPAFAEYSALSVALAEPRQLRMVRYSTYQGAFAGPKVSGRDYPDLVADGRVSIAELTATSAVVAYACGPAGDLCLRSISLFDFGGFYSFRNYTSTWGASFAGVATRISRATVERFEGLNISDTQVTIVLTKGTLNPRNYPDGEVSSATDTFFVLYTDTSGSMWAQKFRRDRYVTFVRVGGAVLVASGVRPTLRGGESRGAHLQRFHYDDLFVSFRDGEDYLPATSANAAKTHTAFVAHPDMSSAPPAADCEVFLSPFSGLVCRLPLLAVVEDNYVDHQNVDFIMEGSTSTSLDRTRLSSNTETTELRFNLNDRADWGNELEFRANITVHYRTADTPWGYPPRRLHIPVTWTPPRVQMTSEGDVPPFTHMGAIRDDNGLDALRTVSASPSTNIRIELVGVNPSEYNLTAVVLVNDAAEEINLSELEGVLTPDVTYPDAVVIETLPNAMNVTTNVAQFMNLRPDFYAAVPLSLVLRFGTVAGTRRQGGGGSVSISNLYVPVNSSNIVLGGETFDAAAGEADNCTCPSALTAEYDSDAIPDATAEALSSITLNTVNWMVEFTVSNVQKITNGHVIAAPVDAQLPASDALSGLVLLFNQSLLWDPPKCNLGQHDVPSNALNVDVGYNGTSCTTAYTVRFSLVDPAQQDPRCELRTEGDEIVVNCSLTLTSTRAYAATEKTALLAQEAAFSGELRLDSQINKEQRDALYATMAKCSVKNGPLFAVDCRIPGAWEFDATSFVIAQEPTGWIDQTTCVQVQTGVATHIECRLNSSAPVQTVEVARANLSATVAGSGGDVVTFDVEYFVARRVTTSTSASLADFVTGVSLKDARYFYGTVDVAELHIDVVDAARLSVTQLELFNSETPKQVRALDSDSRFDLSVRAEPTRFIITFIPAALRDDAAFYRFGPHGVNVSFTFSAARRQADSSDGYVLLENLNVEGVDERDSRPSAAGSSRTRAGRASAAVVAAAAAGACVLVVGGVAAVVVARRQRRQRVEEKNVPAVTL